MNATSFSKSKTAALWVPLCIAILATLFLFYIDEGYYNFRWMAEAGNWVAFVIYVGIISGIQLLLGWLFFRKVGGYLRGVYAGLLTLLLAALCVVFLFS